MTIIISIISAAWSFLSGAGKAVGSFFASLPRWLQITIVAVLALALWSWWLGQHEFDRGTAAQKAADDVKIGILAGDVQTLSASLKAQNDAYAALQKQAADDKATADAAAKGKLEDVEKSRAKEKTRGSGAKAMNDFMTEQFRSAQ